MSGRAHLSAAPGASSRPTAVGDAGCRETPIRPSGPASTELRVGSAHRLVGANETSCPSWRYLCLWAQDRPTASDLVPTGSGCGAIQAVSIELSARNSRLTSVATPAILPKVPLKFLSSSPFNPQRLIPRLTLICRAYWEWCSSCRRARHLGCHRSTRPFRGSAAAGRSAGVLQSKLRNRLVCRGGYSGNLARSLPRLFTHLNGPNVHRNANAWAGV